MLSEHLSEHHSAMWLFVGGQGGGHQMNGSPHVKSLLAGNRTLIVIGFFKSFYSCIFYGGLCLIVRLT